MVLTLPQTRRPTPVALSKTMRVGTPETNSNMFLRAWQTHSAFSEAKTCATPTLEKGKDRTK